MNYIPLRLMFFTFLFFCVSSCTGQIQNNNSNNKVDKTNPITQFNILAIRTNLDKNIRSIFQDKNGNYWFGTNGAGVYRFDGKNLRQFTVQDGLADNQVINIQEDDMGNIWLQSGMFSITKFDGTKFTLQSDKVNFTNGAESDWKAKNNDLWFYAGGGTFRFSNPTLNYLPFQRSSENTQPNAPFSLSRYGVYCILKDSKGNTWFGTQAEGVCRYDGKKLTWFKEKGLAGPAVLGLFEDSKGNLWFGNNGAGLFFYDGKKLTNFTEEQGLSNPDFRVSGKSKPGTMARVYSINEDHLGKVWIGTVDSGVWKYDGTRLTNYTTKDGLTSNAVNTIYKDRSGGLWFGTDRNGICKFNGITFHEFIIN